MNEIIYSVENYYPIEVYHFHLCLSLVGYLLFYLESREAMVFKLICR